MKFYGHFFFLVNGPGAAAEDFVRSTVLSFGFQAEMAG